MSPSELIAFDMYFASITSMQFHPGAGTKEHRQLSLQECREVAMQMLALRSQVVKTEG